MAPHSTRRWHYVSVPARLAEASLLHTGLDVIGVYGCLSSFSSGQSAEPDLRSSTLLLCELPEGHLGSVVIILEQKQTKIETERSRQ